MTEERRTHRRFPTELPAELTAEGGRTIPCRVVDYSLGGMSLEINRLDDMRFVERGNRQALCFFSAAEAGQTPRLHRIEILVRRTSDQYAGVAFAHGLSNTVRPILERAARVYREQHETSSLSAALNPQQIRAFLDKLQAAIDTHLPPLIQACMAALPNKLLEQSEQATNNVIQGKLFETIARVNTKGGKITAGFLAEVRANVEALNQGKLSQFGRSEKEAEQSEKLSLVDENEFEDWLTLRVTAQRGEEYHQDLLEIINEGLSIGLGLGIGKSTNPVAPSLMTLAFHHQVDDTCSSEALLKIFLGIFTQEVIHHLDALYEDIRQLLQKHGLLDLAEKARDEARRAAIRPREERDVLISESELSSIGHSGGGPVQPGNENLFGPATTAPLVPPPLPVGGFSALQNVLEQRNNNLQSAGWVPPEKQGGAADGSGGPAPAAEIGPTLLNQLLGNLQTQAQTTAEDAPSGRLSDLLAQALNAQAGDEPVRLNMEQQKSVDLVENLLDGILQEPGSAAELDQWMHKLQVPILRLILNDPGFLSQQDHPARQVINQIARLAGDRSQKSSSLNKTLQHFVDRIINEYDGDAAIFDETLDELNKIVERRNQSFLRNLQRIRNTQEGHQRLLDARNTVAHLLRKLTGSQPVISIVKQMIEGGWRDLMVTTIVRDGTDSVGYREQGRILCQLLEILPPGKTLADAMSQLPAEEDARALIAQVQEGLELATADAFLVQSVCDDLLSVLLGRAAQLDAERIALEPLGEEVLRIEESALSGADDNDFTLSDRHRLRRLRSMQTGDGILMQSDSDQPRRIRLAWKSDDSARMVFVDDRGLDPQELSMDALLDQLHGGQIEFQLDGDLPAIDKGILRTIQSTYDKLLQETARDPLTGAYTRKEFVRKLEHAVQEARAESRDRILFYLDVDRFKVINSDAGMDAGDALVKRITELAEGNIPRLECSGRMGGDELGLLLADATTEQAVESAEKLRKLVEEMRFEWDGKIFQPTISIGIVEIHHGLKDVNELMRTADSACFAAKSLGRNRAHLYISTDSLSSRQTTMMSWVSRINRCLEEGRIELRLQPITAVNGNGSGTHHHEVLMAVMDEDGQPGSPFEFIQAAEAYGRIQSVDKWVVRRVLGWLRDNPALHEQVGGVAINLSGASVGDERFLEFLLAEIKACGVQPAMLGFEVTETVTVSSLEAASEFISEIRAAGCPFSLDDFGSGMSSFAYLRTMPVDYLKIDGVFIKDIVSTPSDFAMVKSINEIGHFLGKKTIAEYVENEEILRKLREIGIDYAQGWHISKPIPMHRFGTQ